MLNLRNIVKHLPLLAQAISGSRSQLLQIIQIVRIEFHTVFRSLTRIE